MGRKPPTPPPAPQDDWEPEWESDVSDVEDYTRKPRTADHRRRDTHDRDGNGDWRPAMRRR